MKVDKPGQTEVAYPVNAWKFVVEERGGGFYACKIGIHENARKTPRLIAVCRTFAEAKAEAEKAHRRSEAACLL